MIYDYRRLRVGFETSIDVGVCKALNEVLYSYPDLVKAIDEDCKKALAPYSIKNKSLNKPEYSPSFSSLVHAVVCDQALAPHRGMFKVLYINPFQSNDTVDAQYRPASGSRILFSRLKTNEKDETFTVDVRMELITGDGIRFAHVLFTDKFHICMDDDEIHFTLVQSSISPERIAS